MIRAVCVLALLLAACDGPTISGTTCSDDKDCNLFNAQGRCESTGYCSFPDETCTSGHRYSPGASGELASACVEGTSQCGAKDQVCCGASVCAANLTCVTEMATCQCGATDQPCCDGTTCGLPCPMVFCSGTCGVGAACVVWA